MKHKITFLSFIFLLLVSGSNATVRYVKTTGSGDGSSWANASSDLQAMIDISVANDEIWVAAGTYVPQQTPGGNTDGGRNNAFYINKGKIKIYGGFRNNITDADTDNSLSGRNWDTYPTILSGNRGTDNTYHVIVAMDADSTYIDGFIISDGRADGTGSIVVNGTNIYQANGGGVYLYRSTLLFARTIIRNNTAGFGGAVYCWGGSPKASFIAQSSLICNNTVTQDGSAIYFYDPTANQEDNFMIISYSTITKNTSPTNAYVISATSSAFLVLGYLNGSIIWGNNTNIGSVPLTLTTIEPNHIQGSTDPSDLIDPKLDDLNGYRLMEGSPAIDEGDNSDIGSGSTLITERDLGGHSRIIGKSVDAGAYEYLARNEWKGTPTSNDWGTAAGWTNNIIPGDNENIYFNEYPYNDLYLDQNRTVDTIFNNSTKNVYLNKNHLTLTGNIISTSNAYINGTNIDDTLTLAGNASQQIPLLWNSIVGNLIFNKYDQSVLNGPVYTTIDSLTILNNMDIIESSGLIIPPGKYLSVGNIATNGSGTDGLIIKASADGTMPNGTFIFHNPENTPILGTVEMYSKAFYDTDYKWQYFTSPVREGFTANESFKGSYVRKWNESESATDQYSTRYWKWVYDNTPFSPYMGYEITQASPKVLVFNGELENSTYTYPLTYTYAGEADEWAGQHVLGNPYTAAMNISNLTFGNGSDIEQTVYIYNTGSYDDWASHNNGEPSNVETTADGQYVSVPVAQAGIGGLPAQIPSMQGFVIRAMSANAANDIVFDYNALVTKNRVLQRAKPFSEKTYTIVKLKSENSFDKLWFFTEPHCTRGFDNGWDGFKFEGEAGIAQIFAVEEDGNKYQVNSVDDLNQSYIGFKAGAKDTEYELVFEHINNDLLYKNIYLEDLVKNIIVDITESGSVYSFTANNSTTEKRFRIITNEDVSTELEKVNKNQVRVYTYDNSIIIENKKNKPAQLQLFNIAGHIIQVQNAASNSSTRINSSTLPKGIYVVKINFEDEQFSRYAVLY